MRHLVEVQDCTYRANPKETALLAFYANAIAHLLPAEDVRAAALRHAPEAKQAH
jgi:glycerol-3-phosphate O-acyltransferase